MCSLTVLEAEIQNQSQGQGVSRANFWCKGLCFNQLSHQAGPPRLMFDWLTGYYSLVKLTHILTIIDMFKIQQEAMWLNRCDKQKVVRGNVRERLEGLQCRPLKRIKFWKYYFRESEGPVLRLKNIHVECTKLYNNVISSNSQQSKFRQGEARYLNWTKDFF